MNEQDEDQQVRVARDIRADLRQRLETYQAEDTFGERMGQDIASAQDLKRTMSALRRKLREQENRILRIEAKWLRAVVAHSPVAGSRVDLLAADGLLNKLGMDFQPTALGAEVMKRFA